MAQFPSEIIELTSCEHWQKLKLAHKAILLCFSSSWCAPCRSMEGTLMNTAFELKDQAVVVKADLDKFQTLAQELGIKSIPAYIVINQGQASFPTFGIQSVDKLIELVEYCD